MFHQRMANHLFYSAYCYLMRNELILSLTAILLTLAFVGVGSVFAQNETGANMTSVANMTNTTSGGNATGNMTSDTGANTAKTELEEGIKALQGGDVEGARTHLTAAQEAMTDSPPDAIRHFDEGMKALDSGDNSAAIMHLNIANEALG
jgi:hypothetical protein